ncbi:hypothetical protein [Deinococcus knuensis]|uniref:Pilus assembly protein PilP n=1 Tax=Deinococcus knuensis TaxID=1837380 RepID=A0ABQ2SDI9_9DEIO|nr:hypothetical protein [Deinococcus knuensis]GGS15870.1 hypothetical protein GCM10008961_04200 [Deinococcus knuensis]
MTRAPVKLSREMKLLLLLLLMVALIGLWYLLTNRSASDELANQPQPPVVTGTGPGDDTIPVTPTPATGQDGTPAATTPGVAVQPDAPVQVEVIPPFPTDGTGTDGEATTDVPPTPSGINPETELAAVPGNNPFRPLQLDANAAAGNGSPVTAPAGAPVVTPSAALPEPVAVPTNPSSFGSADGPLAITPLPGSSSGSVSGAGPLPVPTIPGGDGSTGTSASPVVVTPIPGGGPVAITPGNSAGSNGTGSNGAGSNGVGTGDGSVTPTPAPIKPPVAGVSVPSVTRVPTLTPQTGTTGAAGTATGTGTGAGDGTLASAPVTGTPRPGTPQVITDLGSGNASVPTLNELDSFVQAQDLAFNAVVLGPVNTAIFRSKDGFVVVSVGQTLPDTQVTVKEVTATSATLSLGNNSKTLELDKR